MSLTAEIKEKHLRHKLTAFYGVILILEVWIEAAVFILTVVMFSSRNTTF